MLHIYFVCGNISPALTSLNMKNANAPPTRHQSLSLAPTLSLAVSIYGFFFLLQHERPSVFPLTDVCAWMHTDIHIMHVCTHTFSLSHSPTQSCRNRMIAKSNETPPVFQREGVCAKQWYEIKKGIKDEGEADGRSGHGGLYVLVKVALGNKSSFECAPTQKRD